MLMFKLFCATLTRHLAAFTVCQNWHETTRRLQWWQSHSHWHLLYPHSYTLIYTNCYKHSHTQLYIVLQLHLYSRLYFSLQWGKHTYRSLFNRPKACVPYETQFLSFLFFTMTVTKCSLGNKKTATSCPLHRQGGSKGYKWFKIQNIGQIWVRLLFCFNLFVSCLLCSCSQ